MSSADTIREELAKEEAAKYTPKAKKPFFSLVKPKEALMLLAPFLGIAISAIEHVALPNVHPVAYYPKTWLPTLAVCAGIYAVIYILCVFIRPLRERFLRFPWLIFAIFCFFTLQDYLTLKTGTLKMPFIPSPDRIMHELIGNADTIASDAVASMRILFAGLIIGITMGVFSGIACGCVRVFDYWVNPLLKIIGPVPALIWMPIFFIIFHSSTAAALSAVVLASWFPLTLMIGSAIKNIDHRLIERAETLGASKMHIVFHVMLPNSIPAIANALFMAFSHSFGAMSATELCGATEGLMFRIQYIRVLANYGEVFAIIGVMIVIFSTMTAVMFAFRNWLLRWQKGLARW